jgi:hypothetical protein
MDAKFSDQCELLGHFFTFLANHGRLKRAPKNWPAFALVRLAAQSKQPLN